MAVLLLLCPACGPAASGGPGGGADGGEDGGSTDGGGARGGEDAEDADGDAGGDAAEQPMRAGVTQAGNFFVHFTPDPDPIPVNEPFELDVWVKQAKDRAPVLDASVYIEAWMPEHAHGMHLVPRVIARDADGRYRLRGMLFHMPGRWQITIDIVRAHLAEGIRFDMVIE